MKVLVVDDEKLARERLTRLLFGLDNNMDILQTDNGVSALRLIDEYAPTVLLLDIHMPIMDGIEVAEHLMRITMPPAVIFTTAHADYAVQAFDTNALDYLMKPIRKERLLQALKKSQSIASLADRLLKTNRRSSCWRTFAFKHHDSGAFSDHSH